ncbi:MAG: hypothetical protein ABIA12_00240 [Candidatus Aenigmatarchaeota archaeon]
MFISKCLDLRRALKSAVVLYALIFTFASALMFYVPFAALDYAVMLLVAVLTFIVAKHYFNAFKPAHPMCNGLALGVVFAAVMFVLDVLLMVYGFASELGWSYFMTTSQIVGYAIIILAPVLAAKSAAGMKAGKARRRRR